MKVLVACEESQRVCTAFRERGHEAYSCDIQEPSGGHPEWHILGDALGVINGRTTFRTMDGQVHKIWDKWDLIIAHPPCTYLSNAGEKYFDINEYMWKAVDRWRKRLDAAEFFLHIMSASCDRICVENPVGFLNSKYRKPDQIIEPYQFGHPFRKKTCLWLKGLPPLIPTDIVENPVPTDKADWFQHGKRSERQKNRSKTFPGIARAMAEQWG